MSIYSFNTNQDNNDPVAVEMINEAMQLASTDPQKALDLYINAAELVDRLPAEHALKAATLISKTPENLQTDFEKTRIIATFLGMIRNEPKIENTMYRAYERTVALWSDSGFMAKPHLVTMGEGGGVNFVELIPPKSFEFSDPEKNELYESFCLPRLMYGVFVNTLCDEDDSGVEYGPITLITAPAKTDKQIDEWLGRWFMGTPRYISQELKVYIQARLKMKGLDIPVPDYEPLPATTEWFKNVYCWMFKKISC